MTIYIEDEKLKEANDRCERAVFELQMISTQRLKDKDFGEFKRIVGKIEGVKLAQSYFNECLKDL